MTYLRSAATLMVLWLIGPSGCAPLAGHVEDDSSLSNTIEPAVEEPEPPRIDWASASDCLGKLRLLQQGMNAGYIETLETTPFAVISDQQSSRWSGPSLQDPQASAKMSDDQAKRCIIRLGEVRDHKAEHRSLGRERVRRLARTAFQ